MILKLLISFLAIVLISSALNAQQLRIFAGTGFGYENKKIKTLENDFFSGIINREIIYVKAAELGAGLGINKNLEVGGDFSYTSAILNTVVGPSSINEIAWFSMGGLAKYVLLPHNTLQFAIQASVGAHIGYPKRMNDDTVERQVAFYAGLHGGPQYKFSDKFMVSYYYGRGKFRNMLLLTYSISAKDSK